MTASWSKGKTSIGYIWLLSSESVEYILSCLVLSCLKLKEENLKLSWSGQRRKKRFHGVGAAYEILVLRTPVRFWVGPFLCRSGVGRGLWHGNRL